MYKTYTVIKATDIRSGAGSSHESKASMKPKYHIWADPDVKKISGAGNPYYKAKRNGISGWVRAKHIEACSNIFAIENGDGKHISNKVRGVVRYSVYNQKSYDNDEIIVKHGCGYCSVASAMAIVDKYMNPVSVKKAIHKKFGAGNALSAYGIKKYCDSIGVKAEIITNSDKVEIKKKMDIALKANKPICFCTKSPHWILATGYDSKGMVVCISSTGEPVFKKTLDNLISTGIDTSTLPETIYWKNSSSGKPVIIG